MNSHRETLPLFVNTAVQEDFLNSFVQARIHGAPAVSLSVDQGYHLARHGLGISGSVDTCAG